MNDGGGPEALFRSTMHGEQPGRPSALVDFRPMDPTNRPTPLKRYDRRALPLPTDLPRSSLPAAAVLSGQRRDDGELDDRLLGALLFLAGGVTRVAYQTNGDPIWFRTSMSAGNLHPLEVYVLRDGVAHYQPLEHALVPLRRAITPTDPVAVTLVVTGIPFRTCWKYGERGWRHLWWDAGCLLANLLASADAYGVPAEVVLAFADTSIARLIGVNGIDEVPLALVRLGRGCFDLPAEQTLTPVTAEAEPVAPRLLRFPLVTDAQAGSSLDEEEVAGWRAAAAQFSESSLQVVQAPSSVDLADRIEDVILRRGSTRLFRIEPAPAQLLSWGLAAATRAIPFDVGSGGGWLEHFVNVHDIAGLESGGYLYRGASSFEGRTRTDDARGYGARLCLDQPLGGDSAYTVFHSAHLESLSTDLGGRAYRVALLEAGVVAGRLALSAVARHGGATGLTFYDGLVRRYFRTEATPMLATAVGIPATAPAPSGKPGAPVELRHYSDVMARLALRRSQ
jgi:SagB-type dehydrogenase family enzyme